MPRVFMDSGRLPGRILPRLAHQPEPVEQARQRPAQEDERGDGIHRQVLRGFRQCGLDLRVGYQRDAAGIGPALHLFHRRRQQGGDGGFGGLVRGHRHPVQHHERHADGGVGHLRRSLRESRADGRRPYDRGGWEVHHRH